MATFNSIADEITGALNRPFDMMFRERVKEIFRHELARMLRESIDKNGIDSQMKQRYTASLIEVDEADSSIEHNCTILRTEDKIFVPVRFKTSEPFIFIGNDNIPYVYRHSIEAKRFAILLTLSGRAISYDYRNGYIYIYNGSRIKNVTIESVFENPADIISVETATQAASTRDTCKDDMVIPIAEDLIQRVKDMLLKGELSIIDDKDKIKATHLDNN